MGLISDLLGTLRSTFRVGRATFDSSGLTAVRSFVLPDQAGTPALVKHTITSTDASTPVSFDDIKQGWNYTYVWAPSANTSDTVVAHMFFDFTVDTTNGDAVGMSHGVGRYTYFRGKGGGTCGQSFLDEYRFGNLDGTTLGTIYGQKWVLDDDADVSGPMGTLCMVDMQDQSATATWVGKITRNFLDPRTVTTHSGGIVQAPGLIYGDYAFTEQDSGKHFLYFSASDGTLTVPDTLPDGFRVTVTQGNTGAAIFASGGGRTLFEPQSRNRTQGMFQSASLATITNTVLLLSVTAASASVTHTSTAISKTLAANEICTLTAPGLTITLPPKAAGIFCAVVTGNFENTIIDPDTATLGGEANTRPLNVANRRTDFRCDGSDWSY